MFMKWIAAVIGGSLFLGICCISCVEYTPKPRGYVRIEPSKAQYKPLDLSYLPFNFDVSQTAVIEVPDQKKGVTGLNISYPELEAKLYCSYLPITPASLVTVETERQPQNERCTYKVTGKLQIEIALIGLKTELKASKTTKRVIY